MPSHGQGACRSSARLAANSLDLPKFVHVHGATLHREGERASDDRPDTLGAAAAMIVSNVTQEPTEDPRSVDRLDAHAE